MIETQIQSFTAKGFKSLYDAEVAPENVIIQQTRKDFEGDYTINVFPFLKVSREKPEITAQKIGEYLQQSIPEVGSFGVIKGFLNLIIIDDYWTKTLFKEILREDYGKQEPDGDMPVVIEYSSPNTNKPLHLGHIRNNLLGWSVAEILMAAGHEVVKVNLVNDRGIHICKSMLAWKKWFHGKTPVSEEMKGDRLVGECYVRFDLEMKKEVEKLVLAGLDRDKAEQESSLMKEAREMLKKWEDNDKDVRGLWSTMNEWVYEGFDRTYERLGIDFDKIYYESETFLLGKDIVDEGLAKGILFKKQDGSIWADLSSDGLDEKLLMRADGTSVYMTQDLGTAQLRYDDYNPDKLLYVVGNEQNYHFDVLKIVLKKLGRDWAENIIHISYGMVELPHGKMKSREGTVVDADDLMDQMHGTAEAMARELGKVEGLSSEDASNLFEMISMGALKFFILRVDPKKNMLFNPEESIDFNGHTGPFVQYTHARIQSLLRKAADKGLNVLNETYQGKVLPKEKEIIKLLNDYPAIIKDAARNFSPAIIANYVYDLAREYSQFYQEINILREKDVSVAVFRLSLSSATAQVIMSSMGLLGIDVPEKM